VEPSKEAKYKERSLTMTTQKRTHLSEFAEPGMGGPEQGVPAAGGQEVVGLQDGGIDREGAMAKADLYKLASYSHKLYEKIEENTQLEAWVQAKITKAADYIASVYHYLEYEMKFSEYGHHLDNSDTLSEGQKMKIKEVLAEARSKMRDLKVAQAEKISALEEGALTGGDAPCDACGGTGVVHQEAAAVPDHVKGKVASYNRQAKAMHAAVKRLDKNKNGIPDDEEMEEGFEKDSKPGDSFKTGTGGTATKTPTGLKHTAGKNYSGKAAEKETKSKELDEATKTSKPWTDKSGKTHPGTAVKGDKYTGKEAEKETKEKKVDEATKTSKPWTDKSGKTHPGTAVKGDKYTGKEAEKEKKVDEGKPSAGLSKAKKSAVVKKAKAGGDIGKPGKSFDKVAKAAGGGEKGKKIAAAAMWKNVKETTAYMMEKAAAEKMAKKDYDGDGKIESGKDEHAGSVDKAIKASKAKSAVNESVETSRMREQLGRLNRNETHQLVESSEADQIRALTKRLLG
jgi:hypothetical protein